MSMNDVVILLTEGYSLSLGQIKLAKFYTTRDPFLKNWWPTPSQVAFLSLVGKDDSELQQHVDLWFKIGSPRSAEAFKAAVETYNAGAAKP